MRKLTNLLIALAVLLCCLFVFSCTTEEIDHEHNYIERTFKPSCVENGRQEKICTVCDDIILVKNLPAKGHTPGEWQTKVEPTCTISKVEERLCVDCGVAVETTVHKQIGHNPGDWQVITDASCYQNLIEGKVCKVCAFVTETRTGEKIKHQYSQIPIEGNCAVADHVLYTCVFCGFSYRDNYSDVLAAHGETIWIIERAPTCNSEGLQRQICKVCSSSLGESQVVSINPDNHRYVVETIPSTENEKGQIKHTCKFCGHTKISEFETNFLPSQIYEMIATSTVRIEACNKDGTMYAVGSGFFISDSGEIVTNYHVIAGAYSLKVKLFDGTDHNVVAVKGYDASRDLAVIKLDLVGNAYLKVADSDTKTGDEVFALGSPLGLDYTFTSGVVSIPNKTINGAEYLVFTAPLAPGNSGGPLVNAQGEVVGINTQIIEDGQNLNLAIPVSFVSKVDTSVEKTVEELYAETLISNRANVLAYYIMLVKKNQATADGKYIITREILKEESGKYGRNMELIYDEENSSVYVAINWTSGGKHIYTVEFILTSASNEYTMKFYDHGWSQYTAEGTVFANVQMTKEGFVESALIDKAISFKYLNYSQSSNNDLTKRNVKTVIGTAYVHLLETFGEVLGETNTDLTMEHFGFLPVIVEEEQNPQPEQGTEQK